MYSVYCPPAKWIRYSSRGEVVVAAVAVVDERSAHRTVGVSLVVEERDRDVVRIEVDARPLGSQVLRRIRGGELLGGHRIEDVGVPQGEVATSTILVAGLLAEAVDRVLRAASAAHRERVVQRRVRPVVACGVGGRLDDGRAIDAVDIESKRVEPHRDHHGRRAQPNRLGRLLDRELDGIGQRVDTHCVGRRFVERSSTADLDAHDVVGDHIDPQLLAVEPCEQAVLGLLHRIHALESDVVARVDHAQRVLHLARGWLR